MSFSLLVFLSLRGPFKNSFQEIQILGFLLQKMNFHPNPRFMIFNENVFLPNPKFKYPLVCFTQGYYVM